MPDAASQAALDADAAWRAAVAALYAMTREDRPPGTEGLEREDAPVALMRRFGFAALTSLGDARDLRWFLPRLVELLAIEPTNVAQPEVVAGKVVLAGWEHWPEAERAAVRAAFLALWRLWLDGARPWRRPLRESPVSPVQRPDAIVRALATLEIDVAPLLDELRDRARADRALAEEYLEYAEIVADEQLADAGDPFDPAAGAGARYFLSGAAIAGLDGLAGEHQGDEELARRLRAVAGQLRRHDLSG